MKHLIFSLCCLTFLGNAFAQHKIMDFCSAMTTAPVGKKVSVIDILYQDGQFASIQERWIKSKRPTTSVKREYNLIGQVFDSLELIDYKTDTIYVLSTYYFTSCVSEIFNTQKGTFYPVKNSSGEYILKDADDYFADMPPDARFSESTLHQLIFNWDIDSLIQIIKSNGGTLGSEYYMSAIRIILKDNQVVQKDIVYFKPTLRWYL